ncbi:Flp pilus assembly protein TadG [Variovorax boronicumulans]|uniref:TadE/TadG family type IV pilus assembly protein n=1 Tax=Variovorax boronicumulans TaxID=436515 RepID=UPI00277F78D2|nr:TadE/TadG family type IV pilus assembly protein [Variovorax boronicumulans]MDP9919940.1 Flp pilus assembly protein TadG [Variovorax boronicumulans]
MTRVHCPSAKCQRGIAAIEFAFVFMALFFVIYGIATFGAVLYTQQIISRAAEDGARAVPMILSPPLATDDARIEATVRDSLAAALIAPVSANASPGSRRNWLADNTTVKTELTGASGGGPNTTAIVTVTYRYSANRLLPTLPVLDTSRWMPDNLLSRATVAIPS